MTELYIDNKKVVTESKDIKVTRENPYFSSSGDYTLEVEIPLRCITNSEVFGSLHRLDVEKESKEFSAKLVADNFVILMGTASITQVSEKKIKLQLFGGNSDINFMSTVEKVYIDSIDYGELDLTQVQGDITKNIWGGVRSADGETRTIKYARLTITWDPEGAAYCGNISQFLLMPVYDETKDEIKNKSGVYISTNKRIQTSGVAVQPNLLYIINKVVEHFGYTLTYNEVDEEPWNRIFIANARASLQMQDALPHWTVKEFLCEVEYFFNSTFVFDSRTKTAELIKNSNYFKTDLQGYDAEDDFNSEMIQDDDEVEKTLASSNIQYDISDSEEHLYDFLSDEIRQGFEHRQYNSRSEMVTAISAMAESDRKKYIFECPEGDFIWACDIDATDDSSTTGNEGFGPGNRDTSGANTGAAWYIKQVNQFGPLIRDEDTDEYLEIRICPVAISTDHKVPVYQLSQSGSSNHGDKYELIAECTAQMPSLENPVGDDPSQSYSECVWNAITGEEEIEEKQDAEDRIQVFFAGRSLQYINKDDATSQTTKLPFPMAFTDYLDKAVNLESCSYQNTHEPWSMSLRPSGATKYIGQLHENSFRIDTKVETQITFRADSLPDIRKFFLFRNKKYICKKYEINVKPTGIDKVIKGYFYEVK